MNSAYRGDSSRLGWTTEADFLDGQRTDPETLAAELGDSLGQVILCLRNSSGSEILGCVFLQRFDDEKGAGCYLGMLTVRPTLQDSGLGKVLLNEAETFARNWGATRMSLGVVHPRDTLMAWYERRGYRRTGETQAFPYGNPKNGIPKRDDLHFIMFEKSL